MGESHSLETRYTPEAGPALPSARGKLRRKTNGKLNKLSVAFIMALFSIGSSTLIGAKAQ